MVTARTLTSWDTENVLKRPVSKPGRSPQILKLKFNSIYIDGFYRIVALKAPAANWHMDWMQNIICLQAIFRVIGCVIEIIKLNI